MRSAAAPSKSPSVPVAGPGRVVCLASRSPRRREMLAEFGIEHLSQHPGVEDSVLEPGRVTPDQWVAALAYMKASAGATLTWEAGGRSPLILGADTVCVKDGQLIGTPTDAEDARRIIRLLRDGSHAVVTGVALIDPGTGPQSGVPEGPHPGRRLAFVDRAAVRVGSISDGAIELYVASNDWAGKAGAYNLRERIAAGWPITFEGDATTIMGLPMGKLLRQLADFGVRPSTPAASSKRIADEKTETERAS